jgi:hypothetical protein
MNRIGLPIISLIAVTLVGFSGTRQEQRGRPSRYLIPEGYVGWVKINFRIKGASALPVEDDHYLLKFPASGLLETSSDMEYGVASDDYFYYCGNTRRKLESTGWDGDGMIWAVYNGSSGNNSAERTDIHEGFFVGTEEQLKTLGAERDENYQPKVGPVDKSKLTCVAQ